MKQIFSKAAMLLACAAGLTLASCNDYLDVLPKGEKIPQTLAQYEAMLRYEYGVHREPLELSSLLLNDYYSVPSNRLPIAVMNWDESANRIELGDGNNDTSPYSELYSAIAVCNLILEDAPGSTQATDTEKAEVMAYARVLRAMKYWVAANHYAQPYSDATAAETRGVPFITSAAVGAAYPQIPLDALYSFITAEVEGVLIDHSLPAKSMTVLHPNKGTAYAFLARVYLTMGNYEKALSNANLALAEKNNLFDWVAFYNANASEIASWSDTKTIVSPMGHDYVESYNFCSYANSSGRNLSMRKERADRFEADDLRFQVGYYLYSAGGIEYYRARLAGFFNISGMKTVEVFLIKAECLARAGQYDLAMNELNTVRQTRVFPYVPLAASTEAECIAHIRRWKENELMFSLVPFADTRRLNKETAYQKTFSKEVDGVTVTLTPSSHLWTFPFPKGAIAKTSGGQIEHNVNK